MEENKEILLTQEGYDNLEKEVEYLKTEKRAEIAERIRVALGFGDLSENSEYDEAKNAQASNETKIAELENKLRYAKIIDESEVDTKTVQIGNVVKVHDMEFDEDGEWTNIECYFSPLPTGILPANVITKVEELHPEAYINGVEKELGGYVVEVTDAGGIDWDMRFNAQFEYVSQSQDRNDD